MSNWISVNDLLPEDGANVIYYFDQVGVHRGKYDANSNTFYGRSGWLWNDVTHWMPDKGQELPERPA